MLSDLFLRLRALFKRSAIEHELEEELRFHVDRQIETYVRAGMNRDDAQRRVQLEFGGLDQVKEEYRGALGVRLLDDLWRDARYAVRTFGSRCRCRRRSRSGTRGWRIAIHRTHG